MRQAHLNVIEWFLVLTLVGVVYTNGLATMYVHADESAWISSSNVFDEYVQGHFSSPVWSEDYNASIGTSVLFNSTVTRFIIGIGRRIGGLGPGDLNAPYDFALTREQNITTGRMPSPHLVWWSRIAITLLSAVGIALGFYLIKDATSRVGGYVWLVLSVTSTYFLFTLRTAMDEGPLILGCVLVTWSISKFLKVSSGLSFGASRNKDYFLWLVSMGIFVGYSAGVKLNGMILIVPCLAAVLLAAYKTPLVVKKQLAIGLVSASIVIVSAYLAFLAPNPYLWRNPIGGPTKMIEQRVHTMVAQYDGTPDLRIPSGVPHLLFFIKRVYSTFSPLNVNPFEGWYAAPMSVVIIEPILILNLALTGIGLIYCGKQFKRYVATQESHCASATAVLLVALCAGGSAIGVNLDQSRYYVIPIYFSTMLLSMAIDRIAKASDGIDVHLTRPASSHQ